MIRCLCLFVLLGFAAHAVAAQPFDFAPVEGPWRPIYPQFHDGEGLVVAISSGVLYRSLDGGRSWRATTQPPSFASMTPYAGVHLAPGPDDGLYRSTDRGETWSVVAFEGSEVRAVAAADSVYAVDASGDIFRSGGDLDAWTPLDIGLGEGFNNRIAAGPGGALAVQVDDPASVCASVLHVSTDAGATFASTPVERCAGSLRFHQGSLYLLISRDTQQTPFVDAGLFAWNPSTESLDRLTNANLLYPFRLQPNGVLTYVADGELMAVGEAAPDIPDVPGRLTDVLISYESILVNTQEGTAWSDGERYIHVGVRDSGEAWGVARLPGGDFAAATGYQGVFRWDGRWSLTGVTMSNAFRFEPLWGQPDSLLIMQAPTVYSSRTHHVLTEGGTVPLEDVAPELAAACGEERLQSVTFVSDRAVGTCEIRIEESRRFVLDRGGQAILESETGPSIATLWAASDGTLYASEAPDILDPPENPVHVSTDGGVTWTDLSIGVHGSWILEFAEHDGAVWAAGFNHIFRLDGTTWTSTHPTGAIRLAQHAGELYAAGGGGVLQLADGVWSDVATGLDNRSVLGLVIGSDEMGTWAVAGTYGNPETNTTGGVMSTRAGLFVGADSSPDSAGRSLRVSPNPARGLVRIETGLDSFSSAEVSVFDVLGRQVARLKSVGGVAMWDAEAAAPGVYTVRVAEGDARRSGRVVVVR